MPPGTRQLPARLGEEVGRLLVAPPRRRPHRLHRVAWRSACSIISQAAQHPGAGRRQEGDRRDGRQERHHRRRRRRPRRGRRRTVVSAFDYAGQKCSAASRVIVLEAAYDEFVRRLVEATRSLAVGPAEDPGTRVGPVIDRRRAGHDRGLHRAGQGTRRRWPPPREPPEGGWAGGGFYVAPHVFVDVRPDAVDRPGGDLRPRRSPS